jgi:hypothetical protein
MISKIAIKNKKHNQRKQFFVKNTKCSAIYVGSILHIMAEKCLPWRGRVSCPCIWPFCVKKRK